MHIDSNDYGYFVIDGKRVDWDIKLVNDEIRHWRDHKLELDDVKDVVEEKPETIIIGIGLSSVVNVSEEIKEFIKKADIELIILDTTSACKKYNELKEKGVNVAAVLHSTC